jgi:hypothetical protein
MKHFEIKNTLAGAKGGGSKPKPATLNPPKVGDYSIAASFSYSETVDLISDGPIEGLSNSNGYVLNPESYLQGVYLNDVPVEESNESFISRSQQSQTSLIGSGQSSASFTGAMSGAFEIVDNFLEDNIVTPKTVLDRTQNSSYKWNNGNPSEIERLLGANTLNNDNSYRMYDVKNLSSPIVGYTLISQNYYGKNAKDNRWMDTMFGCIDLEPAFSGLVISYGSKEVYGEDERYSSKLESIYRYQERRIEDNYERGSSSFWFGDSSNRSRYQGPTFYTPSEDARQFWLDRNDQGLKTTRDAFLAAKKIAGGTCFFTKRSENEENQKTFYTEICLQISKWDESMDNTNPLGIFRDEISSKIDQLVDDININNTSRSQGKLSSLFLRKRLEALGLNLTKTANEDEQLVYDQITRGNITGLIKSTLQNTQSQIANVINPYIFVEHNDTKVIDGYIESQHKEIFKTENFVEEIVLGKTYTVGELFFYGDVYYKFVKTTTVPSEFPALFVLLIPISLDRWVEVWRGEGVLANSTYFDGIKFEVVSEPFGQYNFDLSIEPISTASRDEFTGKVVNLLIPKIDSNGDWNGKVWGFNIESLNTSMTLGKAQGVNNREDYRTDRAWHYSDNDFYDGYFVQTLMSSEEIEYLKNINGLGVFSNEARAGVINSQKYNYSNVMMEFRNGDQFQEPLSFFKNIYIDKFYNSELLGPFSVRGQLKPGLFGNSESDYLGIQKIRENGTLDKTEEGVPDLNFDAESIPEMDEFYLTSLKEGSSDYRQGTKAFSAWNTSKTDYDERAQPVTHIIQNPNVSSCFITLSLKGLSDTVDKEGTISSRDGNADYASKMPAPLNIRIETGLIDEDGKETTSVEKFFQIIALVESPNYLDIGNPDAKDSLGNYDDVKEIGQTLEGVSEGGISQPFILPPIPYSNTTEDTENREDKREKRYIKITKLSTESNSTLIAKFISLVKVTEIIESQCTDPFASIVGTKIDSRVFNEVPKRTYRGKFKKVKIPSNYFPVLPNSKDKRYFKKESEFAATAKSSKLLYNGDWDGSFKFEWTDNPAWILYDMITATRYGLGQQISESEVNKWDLYKIGRFCDAVDEDGYFLGVKDGRGGIEPRYTCNIAFIEGTKIFDAINSIAAIFRGIVYFQNSTVSFLDDRLKSPIALFTNTNVKDGFFSYSSYKRDEKYNAIEVAYKDRNDDYKSKIEYVENEKDIIERGLFKKEITAAGITSKAMAKRAAKHLMYQTTKENETVAFTAGTEVLLCKPGDLVIVEDDLKTLRSNIGRVLSVDPENLSMRTSEPFNANEYEQSITVYLPTGNKQKADLDEEASRKRVRLGASPYPDFDSNFASFYNFDSYSKGYSDTSNDLGLELYDEYAVYTGTQNQIIWFDTSVTGWVFSTGKAFTDDNNYNLFINSTGQGTFNFKSLTLENAYSSSGFVYDSAESDKRAKPATFNFQSKFEYTSNADLNYFGGLQESDINVNGYQQIRDFNVTGWGGFKGVQAKEYGDIVYIDENDPSANLLKFVPEGSTYRFQSKDASDQVYKIISIMEEDNHSYKVVASKYLSGKYEEIENDINIPEAENTFGYNKSEFTVNDIKYISLEAPEITLDVVQNEDATTITGNWEAVQNATGYYYYLDLPNGQQSPGQTTNGTGFSYNPNLIGNYTIRIQSLADVFNNANYNERYDDSSPASATIYASGQDLENLDGSVVVGVVVTS